MKQVVHLVTQMQQLESFGDKAAWEKVIEKGLDKVYENGINGINAMPPKGGNMDLSDEKMKEIINYMIDSSK